MHAACPDAVQQAATSPNNKTSFGDWCFGVWCFGVVSAQMLREGLESLNVAVWGTRLH